MRSFIFLTFSLFLLLQVSFANEANKITGYTKVQDGVLLNTQTGVTKLRVISDKIIQVIVSPQKSIKNTPNLSEVENLPVFKSFKVSESKTEILLQTKQLTVRVSKGDARISYFDNHGKLILAETAKGKMIKANFQPKDSAYIVQQSFDSPKDEAIYGLGQYQYDIMNWENAHMVMQQKNTAIA